MLEGTRTDYYYYYYYYYCYYCVKAQNSNDSVDLLIYLDYAKTFDRVVYKKLSIKLAAYGILDTLLSCIKHFLSGGTH